MKCYISLIGVLDYLDKFHYVDFFPGMNVVTGKSSTGKSALIEIFDYCFGSDDYTVPEGDITAAAKIYIVVLRFNSICLVIGRKAATDQCFLGEFDGKVVGSDSVIISTDFLGAEYFAPLPVYKKELGRYFGVTMLDVDEDARPREFGGKKRPTPSIRSFASFLLQHQNLVANKHAIFYRFDEKEKREQAIDHFKIFMGVVDQEYFLISQKMNEKKQELRRLELSLPRRREEKEAQKQQIREALEEYAAISGSLLSNIDAARMVERPAWALQQIKAAAVHIDSLSNKFEERRHSLERERSLLTSKLRGLEIKRSAAVSSVQYADEYRQLIADTETPKKIDIARSACPFCYSEHDRISGHANKLTDAINWLNGELRASSYVRESFRVEEKKISSEIEPIRTRLKETQEAIGRLEDGLRELDERRNVSELALRAKLKVEAVLEVLSGRDAVDINEAAEQLKSDIEGLSLLLSKYDADQQLNIIEIEINRAMSSIGMNFDFERSFQPINLKFSLESFDLWHERQDGKKIYLRSMGSGANWLYCHLALFLALMRVFCAHDRFGCKLPPILFLDQPTQVYFPNYQADRSSVFDPAALAEHAQRAAMVDEDIQSVVKMYEELISFCAETKELTGVLPQIIVTDHADHLVLTKPLVFEDYVRARWRTRGFIDNEMSID